MPRSTAHRASSLRLQWLRGRLLSSAGCSQAKATIAHICSGVILAGAPGRGASAKRWASSVAPSFTSGAISAAPRQRRSQWRTVFGQTPSWRAHSRTPVPDPANKIIWARSASFRGVVWARTKRVSTCSCSGLTKMASADRRGIGGLHESGDQQVIRHDTTIVLRLPHPNVLEAWGSISPDRGNSDPPADTESPLPARGTSDRSAVARGDGV